MGVIFYGLKYVGTELTQGFTVGIATQSSSGRVWVIDLVGYHVRHPGDDFCLRVVLYAGRNP